MKLPHALIFAFFYSHCYAFYPDSDAYEKIGDDITNALDSIPDEVQKVVKLIHPDLIGVIKQTACCTTTKLAEAVRTINLCNFNTSFNIFQYVNGCLEDTGMKTIVEKLQNRSLDIYGGIPEFPSQSRCFNPVGLLKDKEFLRSIKESIPSGVRLS